MEVAHLKLLVSVLQQPFTLTRSQRLGWNRTDEAGLLTAAFEHGVVGLVYRTLTTIPSTPPTLLEDFRAASRIQSTRSCILAGELIEIVALFQKHRIEILTLKGPPLSMLAYGHTAIRTFSDLDVLVHPKDVNRAIELLLEQQYEVVTPGPDESEANQKDVRLYRASDGITVELHWALHPPGMHVPVDTAGIWERKQTVTICGHGIPTLGNEDLLLYLCVHGACHGWSRLKWICDLASLIESPAEIDWQAASVRARQAGCCRMLLVGVYLASRLFKVRLPAALVSLDQHSSDGVAQALATRASRKLFAPESLSAEDSDAVTLAYRIHYRERVQDRLLLIKEELRDKWRPNNADVNVIRLPRWFRFLYLLIRPVRLIKTYGLSWMTLALRNDGLKMHLNRF
jgi:hypothetical protein